jgi:hypothetical protein
MSYEYLHTAVWSRRVTLVAMSRRHSGFEALKENVTLDELNGSLEYLFYDGVLAWRRMLS